MKKHAALYFLPLLRAAGIQAGDASKYPPPTELAKRNGDAAKGKEAFTKFCIACHRVGTEGNDLGPNLTDVAARLQKPDIYKSILEPSAVIAQGFEAYTLKLNSGELLTGMLANQNADSVTLKVP